MFQQFKYLDGHGSATRIPQVATVRQRFEEHRIEDIPQALRKELEKPLIAHKIKKGARIAIGAGSRGIANIALVVKSLVEILKGKGADPFVFPAMGSHGGATAEGQGKVLASYGITETYVGAPIRATMQVEERARMEDGTPLYVDQHAAEADGIVLINRIKPHTAFRGPIESGIVKMMIIGMGKIAGAAVMHGDRGMDLFGIVLPDAAEALMPHIPFLFGIGLIEDAYDQTAVIEAIPAESLIPREEELLVKARALMPCLYSDQIDVLVIDQIGKEISGGGFDPNVAGRNCRGVVGFDNVDVNKLVILSLSPHTHGNATGVGLADVITRTLFNAIDLQATYTNVITSTYLDGAAIPIVMETEREAVQLAVRSVPRVRPENIRLVRIKDTLSLGEIVVSEALLEDVELHPSMEVVSSLREMNLEG